LEALNDSIRNIFAAHEIQGCW